MDRLAGESVLKRYRIIGWGCPREIGRIMVLLVIDVQKGITDERLYGFQTFEANLKQLLDASRRYGVEVIYVRHDDGPGSGFTKGDWDFEIYDAFAPKENEKIFYKTVNSCFHPQTGLDSYLKEKNETQVMIVGLQTDFCIDASVKSAFERGYIVFIPAYTNSTTDNEYFSQSTAYHFYNDFMWPRRYASCISFGEAVRMIEGK